MDPVTWQSSLWRIPRGISRCGRWMVLGVSVGCFTTVMELQDSATSGQVDMPSLVEWEVVGFEVGGGVESDPLAEVEAVSVVVEITAEFDEWESGESDSSTVYVALLDAQGEVLDEGEIIPSYSTQAALYSGELDCADQGICWFEGEVWVTVGTAPLKSATLHAAGRSRAVVNRGLGCTEVRQGEFDEVVMGAYLTAM